MAKIEINNLTYYYPESKKPSLCDINLSIASGEFVVLVGSSGSGKSTLLRTISGLVPSFYQGKLEGHVYIDNDRVDQLTRREIAKKVALLFQEPEHQIVKSKVVNEIAFSMENIGVKPKVMRRRVAEVSTALNLVSELEKNVNNLSGGTKQKVVLASVLALQPEILLLDEPISQLDPIASQDILNIVRHLNEDLGMTVIMAEHRLENILSWADKVVALDNGEVLFAGKPREYARWANSNAYRLIPPLSRLFVEAKFSNIPLNIKEARKEIEPLDFVFNEVGNSKLTTTINEPILTIKDLSYKYNKANVAVNNASLKLGKGEWTSIIGHNGAGKSTLLKLICGILKPESGQVLLNGQDIHDSSHNSNLTKVGYVPQNPDDFLYLPTVEEEVTYNLGNVDEDKLVNLLKTLGLDEYRHHNPQDLSFGQKQRVVLASVLIREPQVICLDEPTRGLDYIFKSQLANILQGLKKKGTTLIIVSNDIEFMAEFSDTIIVMFQGEVVGYGDKKELLTDSSFYLPQIGRLFKNINDNILTYGEALPMLKRAKNSLYSVRGNHECN